MDIHNASHRLNFILKDLSINTQEPPQSKKDKADENYARVVKDQLQLIQQDLLQPTSVLLQKISPSTLHNVLSKVTEISNQLQELEKTQGIKNRIEATTLNEIAFLARQTISTINIAETSLKTFLEERKSINQPQSWFSTLAEFACTCFASPAFGYLIEPKVLDNLNASYDKSKERLFSASESDEPAKCIEALSEYAIAYLSDQILHIEKYEPELRAPFLRDLFDDITIGNPKPTAKGVALIKVLENHPTVISKLISVNIMNGAATAYEKIGIIPSDFLVEFLNTCFTESINDISEKAHIDSNPTLGEKFGLEVRKNLLQGTTQKLLSEALLGLAFPNEKDDLIMGTENFLHIVDDVNAQQLLWNLLTTILQEQFTSAFRGFSENDDLTTILLINGFESTQAIMSGSNDSQRADLNIHTLLTTPQHGIGMVGIVFVFFKVIFSSLGEAIAKFRPFFGYDEQVDREVDLTLAPQIENFLKMIQKESGSLVLKAFLYFKGRDLARSLSPAIIKSIKGIEGDEKTKGVNLKNLVTQQFKGLIMATGATEEHEGHIRFTTPSFPKTKQELLDLKNKKDEERKKLDDRLKEAKNNLGTQLEGLIDSIHSTVKFNDVTLSPSASDIEGFLSTLQSFFIGFANACTRKLISLVLWLFNAQKVIQNVGGIAQKKAYDIEQDSFLLRLSEFAAKELAPYKHKTLPKEPINAVPNDGTG